MRTGYISVLSALLLVMNLAGCRTVPYFNPDQSQQGALPLTDTNFQKVDLALLLNPDSGKIVNLCESGSKTSLFGENEYEYQKRLQCAFNRFYQIKNLQRLRRNRVQDRIIAASNQRCAEYKKHVRRTYTTTNTFFGGFTTLAAGLGSIFTSESVVRALAGTAAITSGVRAEVNEVYFQHHTIQILADGFEERRKEILEGILKRRSSASIKDYNVEKAVADAIAYHDACSMITGLQKVALNQKQAQDPGIKQLSKVFGSLGIKSLNLGGPSGSISITGSVPLSDSTVRDTELLQNMLTVFLKAQDVKTQLEGYQRKPELTSLPKIENCEDSGKQLLEKYLVAKLETPTVTPISKEINDLIKKHENALNDSEKTAITKLQGEILELFSKWDVTQDEAQKEKIAKDNHLKLDKARVKKGEYSKILDELNGMVTKVEDVLAIRKKCIPKETS